jgi:integrase
MTDKSFFMSLLDGVRNMAKLPFSVFRRAGQRIFYVSFKNTETGKYLPAISTRQKTEAAAVETAFQWLRDGIPRKGETVPLQKYTLRDMARGSDISPTDCEYICKELHRRGMLKTYVLAGTDQAVGFVEYLSNFWDFENSEYIKEKLRKNHSIHRRYCVEQKNTVERHWKPYFAGRFLGDITRKDLEDFINQLDSMSLSAERKNKIVKVGTIPLKWAYRKEKIEKDVTQGIVWFSGVNKERQILSPEQAAAVFRVEWKDNRSRIANMLAMVTGMRAGEIQGLRIQDLGQDCLYIRHSWNFRDGLKTTKNNENRVAEVPFPGLMRELYDLAKNNPHGQGMDGYVFWTWTMADKPIENDIFLRDLRAALVKTGMSEKSAKVYTFHGWRHYFILS